MFVSESPRESSFGWSEVFATPLSIALGVLAWLGGVTALGDVRGVYLPLMIVSAAAITFLCRADPLVAPVAMAVSQAALAVSHHPDVADGSELVWLPFVMLFVCLPPSVFGRFVAQRVFD